jgi:tRNA(fMet)-specific endonuclease VapC
MKISYLVDTDWIIHYLHGHEEIVKRLISFREEGLAISMTSLAEPYEGIYYSNDPTGNEESLKDFLTEVSVLGIDQEVCKVFGRERGKLRQLKKSVSDFDLLIASTALQYNLTLLTNNRKHFEEVEGLRIISL